MSRLTELTIVMPFFNKKECVKVMIDSIIANTYMDWELLAVDDGSDEATKELLAWYEKEDRRIHCIQRTEAPKGAQTCRNIGLKEAKGKYIIFFDSDDYITPTCLGRRVAEIKAHKDLDFLVFPSGMFKNANFLPYASQNVYGYKIYKDDVMHFAERQLPFVVCNNIYRLSSLRTNNLYWDTGLTSLQDADFNLQAILSGLKYDYILAEPDYGYRITDASSVSSSIGKSKSAGNNLHAIGKFYDKVHERYGNKYDKNLYLGAISILNSMSFSGMNGDFSAALSEVIDMYDPKRSGRLRKKTQIAVTLEKVLGGHRARQIALLPEILTMQVATIVKRRKICQLRKILSRRNNSR